MTRRVVTPQYTELPYCSAENYFHEVLQQECAVFLDSAKVDPKNGRYSFIGVHAFATFTVYGEHCFFNKTQQTEDPFTALSRLLAHYPIQTLKGLPPFQGGMMGVFGYELAHHMERLPKKQAVEPTPDLALGFFDEVIAFDNKEKKAWLFCLGYLKETDAFCEKRAKKQIKLFLEKIAKGPPNAPLLGSEIFTQKISSNFSQEGYIEAVADVVQKINAGDVFEVNIAQRFFAKLQNREQIWPLYRTLRRKNPASFAALVKFKDFYVASSSPERFLKLTNGCVSCAPIKGTVKRVENWDEDQNNQKALIACPKNRAENIMIVDLMRNDLSRVCETESVEVTALCALESFASVHHLVSTIEGKLKPGEDPFSLIRATFPGGSVTGAPKIKAMEIIAEKEPDCRGPYCGSLGYIGFDGNCDLSIVIRSLVIQGTDVTFHGGGAIVSDSCPVVEYDETLSKVKNLMQTVCQEVPDEFVVEEGAKLSAHPSEDLPLPLSPLAPLSGEGWGEGQKPLFPLAPLAGEGWGEGQKSSPFTKKEVLLIDNYDSFVHNLARYFRRLGASTRIVRNDAITLAEIEKNPPSHIVLSPGPLGPDDAGICTALVSHFAGRIPILGVCLGHQAIASAFGGKIKCASRPVYGKSSVIQHTGQSLFKQLPPQLTVGRYHGLIVCQDTLPATLKATAWCDLGQIMALQHTTYPVFGVQFHPESILSEFGSDILSYFLEH